MYETQWLDRHGLHMVRPLRIIDVISHITAAWIASSQSLLAMTCAR